MKTAWEKTFTESKVIDITQLGTLLNDLVLTMKQELEKMGRVYHGKVKVWN